MVINPDSMYYGGYLKAQMTFPKDYPYKPPGKEDRDSERSVGADISQTSASRGPCGTRISIPMGDSVSQSSTHLAKT